jgi:hypothetical protein
MHLRCVLRKSSPLAVNASAKRRAPRGVNMLPHVGSELRVRSKERLDGPGPGLAGASDGALPVAPAGYPRRPCHGFVLSAVAMYLRRTMPSGEEGSKLRGSPLREAFATQWRTMLAVLGMNAVGSVGFYLCFIFVTTYLRKTEHIAASTTLDINSFAMLVQLLVIPLAAALSDRIGRRPVLLAAAAGS